MIVELTNEQLVDTIHNIYSHVEYSDLNGESSIILWLMNHPVAQVYHDRVEVFSPEGMPDLVEEVSSQILEIYEV